LAVGCAAPVGAESDAGSTAQKVSVVEVRAWHAPSDGALVRLDAAARFVSVREPGAPSDALELLGLDWSNVSQGACTLVGSEPAPSASPVRVDLRDLSPVRLLLDSREQIELEPRAFPDVAGLVSGVVFVAPSDLAAPTSAKGISLQVGQGVPAISNLELPELPSPLRLIDAVANEGTFTLDGADLKGLDIATAAPREGDQIAVEVVRAGVVRARCGVDASGKLHIEPAALGGIGDATLVIRAQRRVLRDDPLNAVDARLERDLEVRVVIR
jgi:hypothetical protein